ncbi:MAG: methyl-accepting chemotaxis protein [Lachnospiraceae bacterium]|nr:methyl-accepting chemotaxis protein [Lachnospiraceae bacterium]
MGQKEEKMEKRKSLEWFLHKRFVTIGVIMGVLVVLAAAVIVFMSLHMRDLYRQTGDNSHDWIALLGILLGALAVIIIVTVDIILNKMALQIIQRIRVPLDDISSSIKDLSEGRLETEVTYKERDEFAGIVDDTRTTIIHLKTYISNISETLSQLSDKNMDLSVDIDYVGDFIPIKQSIENIISSLNILLGELKESTGGIRLGAQNMTETAASLAAGATTQTNEIQNLVEHIHLITEDVTVNAENAEKVSGLAMDSLDVVENGNQQMLQLLDAMDSIKKQADDISNIIQVINSISDQTKMLSLNASIEAARAGEQGKGFAVVADEIGKLAGECGTAADNTNELISKTIEAVAIGGRLADETAGILKQVVQSSTETSQLINRISGICSKEENDLKVILNGLEKIESVVSNTAAASEESAAVSEELLAMVESLESRISEYHLK